MVALLLLALVAAVPAQAPAAPKPEGRPAVPTNQYEKRQLEGWTVYLHPDFAPHPDVRDKVLDLLRAKLIEIKHVVPTPAVEKLQATAIWLEYDNPRVKCACYHPSAGWLKANGFNVDKAGGVEIGNAGNFLDWSRAQPAMVLHELAHAYHHKVAGYGNPAIKGAFKAATESKKYESVLHINGRTQRHYALTSDQEYFAECSEAFFSTNDFYPFVKAELRQHDPGAYAVLREVWGVGKK